MSGGSRLGALPLLAILTLSSAGALQNSSISQETRRELPDRYHSFLWMLDAPAVDKRLFDRLDALGVSGTNVAGTASSELHGKMRRPFYVDHAAGKGTLFLLDEEWEPLHERFLASDLETGFSRPRCLAEDAVLDAARKRIDEVVSLAGPNRPLGYSLDDEISIARRETPLDLCFADATLERFRRFLAARYHSPAQLSILWGHEFDSFAEVVPPTTHAIRRRELRHEPATWNLVPWADHREFMEQELTGAVRHLADHLRSRDADARIGFTGGGAPSPFSGIDWNRLLEHVDFVEPYDVGGSRELVRSFARPGTLVLRTLFESPAGPHVNRHELWDYFLRGDTGVILWSSRVWFDEGDVDRPSALAKALAPTLKELATPLAAEWMRSRPLPVEVAIVESRPSNHLHWMLDSRWDGRSWVHRTTSHEITHSSQAATREAWNKLLEDAGVPYVHVDAREINDETLAPYRVVVLPRTIALSERAAAAITRFAHRGTVIADCQLALATERLAALDEGRLDALFGIERANHRILLRGKDAGGASPDEAPAISIAEPDLTVVGGRARLEVSDHVAVIEHRHGKHGRTVYLNLLVHRYLEDRRGKSAMWLRDVILGFLEDAGLSAPVVKIEKTGTVPLRVFRRRGDHGILVALLANQRTTTRAFEDDFERASTRVCIDAQKGHLIVPLRPHSDAENTRRFEVDVACDEPVIVRVVDASPDDDDDVRRK